MRLLDIRIYSIVHESIPIGLSWQITDEHGYFIFEPVDAVYLMVSPAYMLLQAGDAFQRPTKRVNALWQIDSHGGL